MRLVRRTSCFLVWAATLTVSVAKVAEVRAEQAQIAGIEKVYLRPSPGTDQTPITVLNAGDYGPVTITKSVSIIAEAGEGGITVPSLTPVFTRVHIPAFDFSTTFKKLEVHGETVFRMVSSDGRDSRFQWIGGATYTWDIGHRWLDQIGVVFEYAREATLGRVDSSIAPFGSTGQIGDLLAPNAFRNAIFARVFFKIDEDTQVRLLSLTDLDNGASGYAQIRLTRRLTDRAQLQASYDILWGAPTSFWGRWANNDRFFLTLKTYF